MSKIRPTWDFYVRCGLALAAFVFILYRIFSVDFIGDEWGMWKDSIQPGLEALLSFQHKDPQSHFLQALCAMPFLKYLAIDRVVAIRIPSLLMFLVYVWAGMHLSRRFANGWFRVLFFAAWIGPQIILEYFGLSRGYAFLLAWGGVALDGLLEAYDPKNTPVWRDRWTKIAIFAAALALLSLLTFAYGYFLLTVLLLLRYYLEEEGNIWAKLKAVLRRGGFVIGTGVVLMAFYLPRYLVLRHSPAMQWGGKSNFVSDTFASIIGCVTYVEFSHERIIFWLGVVVFGVCVADLLAWLWQLRHERTTLSEALTSPLALAAVLLFGLAIGSQLAFWAGGMQFPVRRSMLYLWPMLVLFLGFSWQELRWGVVRWLNVGMLCGVLGFAVCTYNTYRTYEYRQDAQNKEIARMLHELSEGRTEADPLVVGMTDWLRYTLWYYFEYEYEDMAVHPQLKDHPVFRLHGGRLFTYSMNYALPAGVARWHIHPKTDYFLLQGHYEGNVFHETVPYDFAKPPPPELTGYEPVAYFAKSDVSLFAVKEGKRRGGCDPRRCMICQALYQIAGEPVDATATPMGPRQRPGE